MKKHEWKKDEKQIYLPKNQPEIIVIPAFRFFTIRGSGNPNHPEFGNYISALYALSYAVKMSPKSGTAPSGYYDYTVYPLEGVWDISEEGKKNYKGVLDKDTLVFELMIRQPDFVTPDFAAKMMELTSRKKPDPLISNVEFKTIAEGKCVQMLHLGSYDDEPKSFAIMKEFTEKNGLTRKSLIHREIYLSDARKTDPEKLKTVLRFCVA
ncbi:MAG: GyrI-like domain-containing protein [Bacteroidales bacterium]